MTDLETFVVTSFGIHEDFQRVDFKRVCALAWIVGTIVQLTGFVKLAHLVGQATVVLLIKPETSQLCVCLEPETLVVCALERVECLGVELLHALVGSFILCILLDKVEHVVDGLFRIVASDGGLDIGEQLLVVLDGLIVTAQLEFEFDGLLQAFETPSWCQSRVSDYKGKGAHQSPFSSSRAGTPRNSSIASSGLSAFICLAL